MQHWVSGASAVTVRELSRRTRETLERVTRAHEAVVVTSQGRAVVLLLPLLSHGEREEREEERWDEPEGLDEVQRAVLEEVRSGTTEPERIRTNLGLSVSEVGAALGRLELARLVEKTIMGYRPRR